MKKVKVTFITSGQVVEYVMPDALVAEQGLGTVLADLEKSAEFIYNNTDDPKMKFDHQEYNVGLVVKDISAFKYEVIDDGT